MDVFIQSPFFYTKMSDTKKIISVDAMGGDHAPDAVLGGMNQFLYQLMLNISEFDLVINFSYFYLLFLQNNLLIYIYFLYGYYGMI